MNQMTRIANRTAPAARANEPGAVVRRNGDDIEMVNLKWGLRPREEGGRPYTTVRAEGREFRSNRCLLPASEFIVRHEKDSYRFTLTDGDHFYFAGIWQPAGQGWPSSYATITILPNPDIEPLQGWQMAVILRRDRFAWLHHEVPEAELLRPLPAHSFKWEAEGAPALLL